MKSNKILEHIKEEILVDLVKFTFPPAGYLLSGLIKEKQHTLIEASTNQEREKTNKLLIEIQENMNRLELKTLRNFNGISFPLEIHSVIQEIIEEGIRAKGDYLRRIIANAIVYIGSADDPKDLHGKVLCLELIRELNEIDVQMLLIYQLHISQAKQSQLIEMIRGIEENPIIHHQQIQLSSEKLFRLGLVNNAIPKVESHNGFSLKSEYLSLFLSRNHQELEHTFYYETFIRYIYLFQ